jgi:hypothetical protein
VAFGMAIGYPDPDRDTNIRPRPAQNVVLHHERYHDAPEGWLEAYEAAFQDFRTTSRMRQMIWAESIKKSVGYDYLDGRQNLRQTFQERGFKLR